jgi:16S rRNA (guanine966-N2)-methyltransferase
MRIIAGAKRGMKLLSPATNVSRPITDRVKESLFNVLWNYGFPKDKILADLFCGVGSLGLEALSRGAEFVTFVEKDPKIIATLKKNIEKAGFSGESKIIRADAFKIGAPVDPLRRPAVPETARLGRSGSEASERKYDLVFVDPPYSTTRETIPHLSRPGRQRNSYGLEGRPDRCGTPLSKLLVLLTEQLSPDGIVVVRTEKRTRCDEATARRAELLEQYGRLGVIERRQWGTMAVTILQRSNE